MTNLLYTGISSLTRRKKKFSFFPLFVVIVVVFHDIGMKGFCHLVLKNDSRRGGNSSLVFFFLK